MSICYAIKDWEKHFENSESRKIKSLTWVPVKNKHDGKGYRRVASHPKSAQVFCAWNLIIQVASKMPVRGVLRDEDGPLTTSDLSVKTGYPENIFETAITVLTDPKIGWLIQVNGSNLPVRPEPSGDVGTEQKGMEQKGMEQKGTEQKDVGAKGSPPTTDVEWLAELKLNKAYETINVEREYGKMSAWCSLNHKHPTRKRFINWLNRCETPMAIAFKKRIESNEIEEKIVAKRL